MQSGLDQQTALWPPRRMEVQPWRERLSAHSNLETWEFPVSRRRGMGIKLVFHCGRGGIV